MKQKSKKKKSNNKNKNNNSNKKRKIILNNSLHNDNKNDRKKYYGGEPFTDPLGVNSAPAEALAGAPSAEPVEESATATAPAGAPAGVPAGAPSAEPVVASAAANNNPDLNPDLTDNPLERGIIQSRQRELEQIKNDITNTSFEFSIDIANNLYPKDNLLSKYNKILDDFNANTDTQSYIELLTYNASPDISNNCFSGYKLYLNAIENYNYFKEDLRNIVNDIYLTWLIKSIRDLSNIINFDKFIDDKLDSKYLKINLNLEFTEAITNAGISLPPSAISGGGPFSREKKNYY